jgi:hypothetical protein
MLKCVIKFIFMHFVRNIAIVFFSVYAPHEISLAHPHPVQAAQQLGIMHIRRLPASANS